MASPFYVFSLLTHAGYKEAQLANQLQNRFKL